MYELFVTYELALLLREKGFNEPCIATYDDVYKEISYDFKVFQAVKNSGDTYKFKGQCFLIIH